MTLQAWLRHCEWSPSSEGDHSQAVRMALFNVELDLHASADGTDRTVLGAAVALSMRSWHAVPPARPTSPTLPLTAAEVP